MIFGFAIKALFCNPVSETALIHHRTIRSILAGGLLALFALAITPKIALHALVAHHTDTHLWLDYGQADQVNKAGFHCATDNLVVELPFLHYSPALQTGRKPSWPVYRPVGPEEPVIAEHPLYGLRGPPVFLFL